MIGHSVCSTHSYKKLDTYYIILVVKWFESIIHVRYIAEDKYVNKSPRHCIKQ